MKLFITLMLVSFNLWSAPLCLDYFKLFKAEISLKSQSTEKSLIEKTTRIEDATKKGLPRLNSNDILIEKIKLLEKEKPELALKIRNARDLKKRGGSLLLDTINLDAKMINFLEGAYKKVIGARGLSQPFVKFEKLSDNILVIHHEGDTYPLMIKWSETAIEPQQATSFKFKGQIYQMLELPATLIERQDLQNLSEKYIYNLISGSSLNRYISSKQSNIMAIASILHDGKLDFDRPTQVESKQLRALLNSDLELRQKVSSLLFVAPTASGKTKVLTDFIVNKIKQANLNLSAQKSNVNKLTVLMTKTPDLTSDLALEVGRQLFDELGDSQYRIIQWGGRLTEEMSHAQLMNFIRESKVPVVLVTSYPTLGIRSKHMSEKNELFKQANALLIDEAHNATGNIFESVMKAAQEIAIADRKAGRATDALDIFGVTASPITKTQRTVELFDSAFWAGIDQVGTWAHKIKKNENDPTKVLEWVRIVDQYNKARDRGEINSSDPIFYRPEENGFKFSSIFKRGDNGTHSSVSIEKLKIIWPKIAEMIEGHGPGVIKTYARDADEIAVTLSELSGKNFVSLQGLSETTRAQVYDAFRNQTDYKGRAVDAIVVARVIEGLDFPKAGWYLSFKKYVKFPENIQDPGRVVRLALNKLSPKIIFFGEEVDKVAYQDVRELIMKRTGRLPRELPAGALFSGRKNNLLRKNLTESIDNVNVALEAFLRTQFDLTKELGTSHNLKPEKIIELQQLLLEMRSSGQNREIAKAIKDLVVQLNAYSFFNGNLLKTWNLCDRLISLEKKGPEAIIKSRLTPAEKAMISDKELMLQVREFRSLLPAIGPVPRALLETLNLRPLNLTELSNSVNAFIELNNKSPFFINEDQNSLAVLLEQAIQVAPEQVWYRLNERSRSNLKESFELSEQKSFEESLELYFKNYKSIPEFSFENLSDPTRSTADYIERRLAEELINKIKEGDLNMASLSSELIVELEKSHTYNGLMLKAIAAVTELVKPQSQTDNVYLQRLKESRQLDFENLSRTGDLRVLQLLNDLAKLDKSGLGISSIYKQRIENVISTFNLNWRQNER